MAQTSSSSAPPALERRLGRPQLYGLLLVIGLLVGLIPTGMGLYRVSGERDALQRQMRVAELEMALGRAAVLARRGDYADSRDAASQFYTSARHEADATENPLRPEYRDALRTLLGDRDAVITLLARSDPSGAERLSEIYVNYRAAVARAGGAP